MDINKHLKEKYDWLEKDDFWQLHKNWILTHNSCSRIAEEENIIFHEPKIMVANENSSVAMLGRATLGKKDVWTTGEASSYNCKNPYFFAMAEKRWKDRATLKLISVYHLGVYSEEEADDFKRSNIDDEQALRKEWKTHRENPIQITKDNSHKKWSEIDESLLHWILTKAKSPKYQLLATLENNFRLKLKDAKG
tara:strand:- start:1806 stop:2387 length:582 start_codon:yes stop_codon:yes gene_type:complete